MLELDGALCIERIEGTFKWWSGRIKRNTPGPDIHCEGFRVKCL